MQYRFNAEEWATLTPTQQAIRCRTMAHEASELARSAGSSRMKRLYLDLSHRWLRLAEEIELHPEAPS